MSIEYSHLNMIGELNPCKPGCRPKIRKFVSKYDVSATYFATSTRKTYNWTKSANGSVIQNVYKDAKMTSSRIYTQGRSGRWHSKRLY